MEVRIKNMGDLMDYANQTDNDNLKAYLRTKFQDFCKQGGRNPWSTSAIMGWRNEPVTAHDISYWVIGEEV